ncbi:leucine-rich repeat-containing protein 41 isoform X2 [Sphaeramia orbicularis]|nr:leucine-rich repeat-containing protein 41 isoform X2 [Sphaeramia orbicularis]
MSTYPAWAFFLEDLLGPNRLFDFQTEEKAKHEVMRMLFILILYGFQNNFTVKNMANLNTPSFLWAAAKCIKHFSILTACEPLKKLTTEQQPVLDLLEKGITRVSVYTLDLSKIAQIGLYVLHRLLDHGEAKEIIVYYSCPTALAWIINGRGSPYVHSTQTQNTKGSSSSPAASTSACESGCRTAGEQGGEVPPCKRPKLDCASEGVHKAGETKYTIDPQALCEAFAPCDSRSAAACPRGQIECLEVTQCQPEGLEVINSALPTWFCLRSLTLHSQSTFKYTDVLSLVRALKQLSESSSSCLTELNISVLPYTELIGMLLDARPSLVSLHVEIHTMLWMPHVTAPVFAEPDTSELPLQRLTVKLTEFQTDLHFITSVLRRSPHLSSLHIAGLRLSGDVSQSQLLSVLSVSNQRLKSLNLEDMNLADCLPDILHLLRNSILEELNLNDCRLLETWTNKEESLLQLVSALTTVPTLHTLGLAQNRLAKNVYVLTELFSGSSPSSLKKLNISSNFIQPTDLLHFAKRLKKHHPPHRLTLDLRKNPGDRDPDMWMAALKKLRPFCFLMVEGWISTDTMADHISNM